MLNKDILLDNRMALPVEYSVGDCKDAIINRLDDYQHLLGLYSVDKKIISLVSRFRTNLEEMFDEYYLGHQNKAYSAFKTALEGLLEGMDIVTDILSKESLYRARINDADIDFKNDEMFHIKYAMRGKIRTQRYSFPGLPCLYLGGSSYVCWLELNRPRLDQFQVAIIRQKDEDKNFKVIDLCNHPQKYYKDLLRYENGDSECLSLDLNQYLQWWPIMAACSIAVRNDADSFKPEYIFPQFMLQYLLEQKTDDDCIGIKYISIKTGKISKKQYESDYRTYTNYVIPIRTLDETKNGFCSLLEKEFTVVRNYSGRELQILSDMIRDNGVEWLEIGEEPQNHPLDEAKIYGTNDMEYSYSRSIFRRIERILENEDMDKYGDMKK